GLGALARVRDTGPQDGDEQHDQQAAHRAFSRHTTSRFTRIHTLSRGLWIARPAIHDTAPPRHWFRKSVAASAASWARVSLCGTSTAAKVEARFTDGPRCGLSPTTALRLASSQGVGM